MAALATLVTGVGRFSLGEALVSEYLSRSPGEKILTASKHLNPDLPTNICQIVLDLNPLNHSAGVKGFATEFLRKLEFGIRNLALGGVRSLVQGAAVYDFGHFIEHDVSRRNGLLGLNVLGTVEVLYGVMELNARLGIVNEESLTQLLIGALHGLQIKPRRPLYASSKAWGIDFSSALAAAGDLKRCVYAAPVPIDTPMLHKNHWVKKCNGSEEFFEFALHGRREDYEAIFFNCNEEALVQVAKNFSPANTVHLRRTLADYLVERSRAKSSDLGVLTAASCAKVLADIGSLADQRSALYLVGVRPDGAPFAKMADFKSLDRYDIFRSVSQALKL